VRGIVSLIMEKTRVPYSDLRSQYQGIKGEIDAAVSRVLDTCQFVLGPEVALFEDEFGRYSGTSDCVALNSGTSALHLALLAAGVGPGDEVITVPFTFIATVAAILYTGARPVLVDIDPRTFTMDPASIAAVISSRTKAIVPVHLYGQTADMDPILDIARRRSLVVIEDAAQAHGAKYKGRPAGSIGDMGCFSFYPAKNLGAYGEGGAVTTNDPEYAKSLRSLRNWGQDRKYHHVMRGYNYRMDGIQGAVLRVKLRHLCEWTERRKMIARTYNELLAKTDVQLPVQMPWAEHVYHLYTLRAKDRDSLQKALQAEGVQTAVHYAEPVHLQPAYADLGYPLGSLPESENAAREVLSLPMYPELSADQVQMVSAAFANFSASRSIR
jgi:dTDP-4-amino-4,6-dideoxygalactose transaminase